MRTAESVVLTCWPPAPDDAVGVDAAVGFVDVDLDGVVDDRIDPDAGERGVPARLAVEGRDAHQPMDARFGLQPAIGVVALDQQRRRLDAGLLAVMDFHDLDLEIVPLRPARIHPQQHLRPVLALGAAGAGMDFEIGVVGVGLAREQRFDLAALDLGRSAFSAASASPTTSPSPSSSPSSISPTLSVERGLRARGRRLSRLPDAGARASASGPPRIVPDVGVFGLVVQIVESLDA